MWRTIVVLLSLANTAFLIALGWFLWGWAKEALNVIKATSTDITTSAYSIAENVSSVQKDFQSTQRRMTAATKAFSDSEPHNI